jgi:hypothetical protein
MDVVIKTTASTRMSTATMAVQEAVEPAVVAIGAVRT